jgi:hypothetical protein
VSAEGDGRRDAARSAWSSPHFWRAALLCLGGGVSIAWVDTRPAWDDDGITAGAVAVMAALGAVLRLQVWLATALVVAPLLVAELRNGPGVLIALPVALGGAVLGWLLRRGASRD